MKKKNACAHVIEHGEQCDCKLLAQTLMMRPEAISFEFCARVLQRHWRMTCLHGSSKPAGIAAGSAERWQGVGPVDAVKAILISNDAGEEDR